MNIVTNDLSREYPAEKEKLISLFLPSLAGGGAERVLINIGDYVSRRGIRVDLLVAAATGEYRNKLPDTLRLIEFGPAKPLHVVPELIRYIRAENPQALLTTITNANLAALIAVRLSKVPTRCFVREASTLSVEIQNSSLLNRLILPFVVKNLYKNAAAVISPSRGVARDLAAITKRPINKINIIPNPIIGPKMRIKARAKPGHPWFDNGAQPIILGIGRLSVQKDFTTLIKAFGIVRQQRKAKLIIIGEGEQRPVLEKLIINETLEADVSLPGFVDNPYACLANAAVFVLSSRWEGLPGVLIEGLACGTRVIATDCPSGPREILDNGRYGQLLPMGDHTAMAVAINRVLDGKYKPVDPACQVDLFDLEKNADTYMRLMLN